jgi:surface antigen
MAQMSGADADALDRLGLQMEQAGRRLAANSKRLRRQINDSPWTGRNADRFRQEYNTLHTRSIAEAARFLDDAYETLSRNARQQREASGQKPGSGLSIWEQIKRWWPPTWLPRLPWWGGRGEWFPMPFYRLPFPRLPFPWPYRPLPLPYLLPGFWRPPAVPVIPKDWITDIFIGLGIIGVATAPGKPGGSEQKPAPAAPAAPPAQPAAPATGPSSKDWGRVISADQARAIADTHVPASERHHYDFNDGNGQGDDWYQCTVWAKARWREMGYTGDWRGNGADVAANINQSLGRANEYQPSQGAIVSFASGHVAVVEEMRTLPNGQVQFRVSEMNMGISEGNPTRYDSADTNMARSSEFRNDRWVNVGQGQTFARFP